MTCYWCYWGWPKPIRDIYDDCVKRAGDSAMKYGPAHIVWADENWDSAKWCLDHFDEWVRDWNHEKHHAGQLAVDHKPVVREWSLNRYTNEQLAVVRESLERLIDVPDQFKHEPEGYDDENPGDFPPPPSWECRPRGFADE